jgi:hypothetical protein
MQIILEDNFKNLYIQKKKKACAKLIWSYNGAILLLQSDSYFSREFIYVSTFKFHRHWHSVQPTQGPDRKSICWRILPFGPLTSLAGLAGEGLFLTKLVYKDWKSWQFLQCIGMNAELYKLSIAETCCTTMKSM